MKKIILKTLKITSIVILLYFLYFFVFFAIASKTNRVVSSDISYDQADILSTSSKDLYATLIDTHKDALDIRIGLVNEATSNITVTSYYYHAGEASDLFTAALLKKADEGIKIDIIVDGKMPQKDLNYKLLKSHDNINYYLFEPLSFLLPYINNNLYHNKVMTIDDKYGLVGGRNVADRFLDENSKYLTYDYEVLVFGSDDEVESVVAMNELVQKTIDYEHTKKVSGKKVRKFEQNKDKLIAKLNDYSSDLTPFSTYTDNKIKVDNITFVENPLNRYNKEPVVAKTIFDLYDGSQEMIIQSPYIVSSKIMRNYFPEYKDYEDIIFVTNNINSNPNFFALSGYLRIRDKMAKKHEVYEYQGDGSIHGKTVTIGNNISVIGSLNIDSRSFFLSTEAVVIIIGEDFNTELKNSVNNIIDQSLKLNDNGQYITDPNVELAPAKNTRRKLASFASFITGMFEHLLNVNI